MSTTVSCEPGLAGGPDQWPAAQKMNMQMVDRLAAIGSHIDHGTVSLIQPQLLGDFLRHQQQVSHQISVLAPNVGQRTNLLTWNDQDVNGRLRTDIVEREAQLVLIHNVSREFSIDDLLEHCGF